MCVAIRSDRIWFSYIPIQFAFGPVQHLYTVLVWKAPVDTGLLGLACVPRGVVHTHPAHLQSHQVVRGKSRGERAYLVKSG